MRKPFVVGLTGGIGTGKSNVRQTLVALGAEGIDADRVAHQVTAPDGPAYEAVVAGFGRDVLATDGQISRSRLGQRVFADPAALAQLEAIIHPAVAEAIRARVAASTARLVVIEAIKLLESGLSRTLCDQVWVTTCSRRQQLARLAAGRGMTAGEARCRLAAQMPPAQMIAQADRVIDTSGTTAETGLLILAAWRELGLPFPASVIRPATVDDAEGTAAVLNAIVREGGLTVLARTFTPAQERAFLRRLPARARLTVALVGNVVAGFQVIEPYASYTGAMNHVATLGSYVVAALRCQGVGRALSEATLAYARQAGFTKIVINVRADNPGAQAFYTGLGFQSCGRLTRQAFVDGQYVDELLFELFLDWAEASDEPTSQAVGRTP
jgi:dephospho-CoA kinase